MVIEKKPFTRQHLEKQRDSFTVVLNEEERELLDKVKKIMEQSKDSTILKQLAWIGAYYIFDERISFILGVIFKDKRKCLNYQKL